MEKAQLFMRNSLYLVFTLITGLMVLAQILELSSGQVVISIFVLLLHVPSLLPIHVARRFSIIELGRYSELLFSAVIFLGWQVAGEIKLSFTYTLIAGGVFAVTVGLQFGAVRMINRISERANIIGGHNPYFDAANLVKPIKRLIPIMRIGTVSLSFVALMMFLSPGIATYWWFPLVGTVIALTALLPLLIGVNLKTMAMHAASSAETAVATSVANNPPKCAIYYSCSETSNHNQLMFTVAELKKANIPTALISREKHSVQVCRSAKPDYLWRAPTIGTLDTFIQPSIKVAIYLNDASKNAHFIRFNHLAHILYAQSEPTYRLKRLPNNMLVYDAIVAPSNNVAALWRQNSDTDIAARIVIINSRVIPSYLAIPKHSFKDEEGTSIPLNAAGNKEHIPAPNSFMRWQYDSLCELIDDVVNIKTHNNLQS